MKSIELSDKELIVNYADGDESAMSTLVERHRRRVTDYINMMVKDKDISNDIFQEAIIRAVRFIDEGRYKESGRFLSWLLRIAHNQVIDHFRQTKQLKQINEADAGYDIIGTQRLSQDNVEDKMVQSQIESDVRMLIDELPEEQRQVVMMRYYSEMSFQEIADKTGVSINTALGRMRYALINMRKMIQDKQLSLSI